MVFGFMKKKVDVKVEECCWCSVVDDVVVVVDSIDELFMSFVEILVFVEV